MTLIKDKNNMFIVSGTGDIIEHDDNIAAIGSGGPYALAAAKALIKYMITQRVLSHGKGGGGWRLWGARVILIR